MVCKSLVPSTLCLYVLIKVHLLGIHIDTKGRIYAGCGDGVHVWNPSGTDILSLLFLFGQTIHSHVQYAPATSRLPTPERPNFYHKRII
jgi:hypothetical protein